MTLKGNKKKTMNSSWAGIFVLVLMLLLQEPLTMLVTEFEFIFHNILLEP